MQGTPAPLQSLAPSPPEEKPPPPPPGQTFLFQGQPIGETPGERERQDPQEDEAWGGARSGPGSRGGNGRVSRAHSLPTLSAVNRPLNLQDQQKFARSVGLKWRKVGRSLQRSCRALRDPALDSLAYEYERDGLYEQAFQLLRRFVQAEGRRATLQRLVEALEETFGFSFSSDLETVWLLLFHTLSLHPFSPSLLQGLQGHTCWARGIPAQGPPRCCPSVSPSLGCLSNCFHFSLQGH